MGSILSKPKAPDTSKQEASLAKQEKEVAARELATKQADAASMRARRGRNAAKNSLITSGNETGVARTTLG